MVRIRLSGALMVGHVHFLSEGADGERTPANRACFVGAPPAAAARRPRPTIQRATASWRRPTATTKGMAGTTEAWDRGGARRGGLVVAGMSVLAGVLALVLKGAAGATLAHLPLAPKATAASAASPGRVGPR